MKIIFLDIDGVLNCRSTKERINGYIGIDPKKVELLKLIVDATGAKIILSSSWRQCRDSILMRKMWDYMVESLKSQELEIFDITPYDCETSYRGFEIQTWFKEHKDKNIESFIILDDDCDLKPYGSRHIQTAYFKNGLEQKHVDKAIKMLGEECRPWFDEAPYWREEYNADNRQI